MGTVILVIYLFIALIGLMLLDAVVLTAEQKKRLHPWSPVAAALIWPIILIALIIHFIRKANERRRKI